MNLLVLHESMVDKVTQQEFDNGSWIASSGIRTGSQVGSMTSILHHLIVTSLQRSRIISLEGSIHKEIL